MPPPRTIREFKSYRREVGRTVARELGNSTAIALKSYVSPEVFCYWEPTNDFVDKDGKKRPSLTNDFLDCVHYDKTVPPAETSGTAPD
jgi:DNA topoisomerase IB